MDKPYDIFVSISDTHDFKLKQVASYDNGSLTVVQTGFNALDNLNHRICHDIHKMTTDRSFLNSSGGAMGEPRLYEASSMQAVMFHRIRWRRCTGFVLLQQSDRGKSLVCYFLGRRNDQSDPEHPSLPCPLIYKNWELFRQEIWKVYKEWEAMCKRSKVWNIYRMYGMYIEDFKMFNLLIRDGEDYRLGV
jgi:hypothetical protein